MGDVQAAREVKGINPALKVLYRHVNNEGYVWSDDWEANVAQAELEYRRYVDGSFADLAEFVDYVEEPRNEYVDNGMNEAQISQRVMWARACAYVWQTVFQPQFPHISCAIGSQPVGNDVPMGFFEAAHDFDAVLSTHAYVHFNTRDVRDELDFRYHSGRWAHDDEQARALGYEVDIAITETGPYDGSTWNGWRSSNVLGGDIEKYVDAMRAVIRDWMQTHAAQTGRLLGFNLFTTNRSGWDNYLTNQPELNALAEMTAQEWRPGEEPPPPPEPRRYQRTYHLLPQDATEAEAQHVTALAYPARQTVGYSADDAFVNPEELTARTVIVWDADAWGGAEALEAWAGEHYGLPDRIEYRELPVEETGFRFHVWPTVERRVTQRFGANPDAYARFGLPGHEGIDLAAPLGTAYFCVAPGEVVWVSDRRRSDNALSAYGWHVIVDHGDGYTTLYAHAHPEPPVRAGDAVAAGDTLAFSGNTGNSSGAHLHLTVKLEGHQIPGWPAGYVDPTQFVEPYEPEWP